MSQKAIQLSTEDERVQTVSELQLVIILYLADMFFCFLILCLLAKHPMKQRQDFNKTIDIFNQITSAVDLIHDGCHG